MVFARFRSRLRCFAFAALPALAATLGCLAATATAGPASTAPSLPASLTGYNCRQALDPVLRALTVTAVMRPVTGTHAMEMRFDLLSATTRHGRYRQVHGANLGVWLHPRNPALGQRPGDLWRVQHPIVGLSAPAFYRVVVTYRWLDAKGTKLAQATQQTQLCHQPELRPDVAVAALTVKPLAPASGQDAYIADLRNHGVTAAGPFSVQLTLPDGTVLTKSVAGLAAHRSRSLRFVAAACTSGQPLTVLADPAGAIDDYDRANNTLTTDCPAS